ncbi:MAG TPA: hypothetical protein GX747_04380 [Tenericutes bacterium]|nr:hypothetical protein [Mycoplasmatota bacterium]
MESVTLIVITIFILASVTIVVVLNIIQNIKTKKIKKIINQLEIEKNMIDSSPIIPELSKIEVFLKNEKLEIMYNDWKKRLDDIKKNQIPKITDMLIEVEFSLSQVDYKSTLYKLAKLEMEMYKVKANSDFLLGEIKEITTSEEKNRAIVTKLKNKYRDLYKKFSSEKVDYGTVESSITLQFENIAKRFELFEKTMENNEYTEVTQIIKSIDEMLKHMEVVVEEVPAIVLLAKTILPKKIKDIEQIYQTMVLDGYPLDYLNVEYNIEEANKKTNDIITRAHVLNLEDSLFELKVLTEYFDSLYSDFEKEKIYRQDYNNMSKRFIDKMTKLNELVSNILKQIDEIKNAYNLSAKDIKLLMDIKDQLKFLEEDYKILEAHTGNNTFAYSKLLKEIEDLSQRLANIEENLDNSLDAIGSMKEDEIRARQQLEEVKQILKESKLKIRDYNLPIVPESYFIELNEAQLAIKEIIKELEKKPITINILNTRVDTARDLVLKLYTKTKDMIKSCMLAEMAIVYGNRYRTNISDVDKYLTNSEVLFYKGEYQKSLEITINSLNKIEPDIYNKLLKLYGYEN